MDFTCAVLRSERVTFYNPSHSSMGRPLASLNVGRVGYEGAVARAQEILGDARNALDLFRRIVRSASGDPEMKFEAYFAANASDPLRPGYGQRLPHYTQAFAFVFVQEDRIDAVRNALLSLLNVNLLQSVSEMVERPFEFRAVVMYRGTALSGLFWAQMSNANEKDLLVSNFHPETHEVSFFRRLFLNVHEVDINEKLTIHKYRLSNGHDFGIMFDYPAYSWHLDIRNAESAYVHLNIWMPDREEYRFHRVLAPIPIEDARELDRILNEERVEMIREAGDPLPPELMRLVGAFLTG